MSLLAAIGRLRNARRDRRGIAMVEFALVMPLFLVTGMWGIELANYQYQIMQIQQLAAHVADNASRIGDYSTLDNRKIYESDIDDLMVGAGLQAGTRIDLFNRGRVIISSLDADDKGKQRIGWQRCIGVKKVASSYGKKGPVAATGIGPKGKEVVAQPRDAVMFVEIQYDYDPLISDQFVGEPLIASVASFTVRSSRDLKGPNETGEPYQTSPPSPKMTCDKFTNAVG